MSQPAGQHRAREPNNLFDEVYLSRSQTGIGVFAYQYGPRRSVFASMTKEF